MFKEALKRTIRWMLSPFVLNDYLLFKGLDKEKRFQLEFIDIHPQIKDKTFRTTFDRHYVYHTSWAARKLKEINPSKHIDVSSSLYFSGIVSAFIPIEFYDLRPANLNLSNLESKKSDLLNLPFADNSIFSLSCMHTIEHVGLGRYGDPIDPGADVKAISELKRVLTPGGNFLFVVPIGSKPIIEFNAHRIYTYEQILSLMKDLELKEFSLIPEHEKDGGLILNADPSLVSKERYACGCFWFIKNKHER